MQAVMISMESRQDTAYETAERLLAGGVTTKIFFQPPDWEVGPPGNFRNSKRAVEWAVENVSGHGFLFVEDDIIIKRDRFERALSAADDLKELMYLYMHDKGPRIDHYPGSDWRRALINYSTKSGSRKGDISDLVIPEGPKLMDEDAQMFGSQAVYIPKGHARFLLAFMSNDVSYSKTIRARKSMAFDMVLNKWRFDSGIPVYCYVPHPVQHLQNRTSRRGSRSDVYSLSFGLRSNLEVGDV